MNLHTIGRRSSITMLILILVALAGLALAWQPTDAQQADPASTPVSSITLTGTIDSVDTRFIIVSGLLADLEALEIPPGYLQVGMRVTIVGNLQNGLIRAITIIFGGDDDDDDDDDSSPTRTPTITPTPVTVTPTPGGPTMTPTPRRDDDDDDDDDRVRIIIEGPVTFITMNSIRIFDLDITINQNIVNITNINIGDNVRVEGDLTIINNIVNIVAVNITIINPDRGDSRVSRPRPGDGGRPAPPPPPSRGRSRSSRSS